MSAGRVYRFASHGECYTSHDYSVASGSTVRRDPYGHLPPGYDGGMREAVADVRRWVAECARLDGKGGES